MKKAIGYGFKMASESWEDVLQVYSGRFLPTRKEAEREAREARAKKHIGRRAKVRIFQLIVALDAEELKP